jgi:hypothetical protein
MRAENRRIPPPLDPVARRRLAALIRRVGERAAAALLDTPRSTLARALAALPVRVASADVIRTRLDALDGNHRGHRD